MKYMTSCFKVAVLTGAVLFAPVSGVFAGERYSESFAGPEGGLPDGWGAATVSAVSVAEVRSSPAGDKALLLQRTPEGVGSACVFYKGAGTGTPPAVMGDFSASVALRMDQPAKSNSCSHGMLLRAKKISYKGSKGYYLAVSPVGESAGIAIFYDPKSHVENGERLAFTPIDGLKPGVDYILVAKASGATIEGELWSVDSAGAKKDMLGAVKTDDATGANEGHFALRNGLGNTGPIGTWYKALHLATED